MALLVTETSWRQEVAARHDMLGVCAYSLFYKLACDWKEASHDIYRILMRNVRLRRYLVEVMAKMLA